MKDLSGKRLANYDVRERLGAGGMAVVYLAIQQPLGREVALKALTPGLIEDPGFIRRFEQEAKTLARLDHPNILPIIDFVVLQDVVFITMPLVRGGTLRDILNRGSLDGATAFRFLLEVGLGLQHAHDAGIIHRDLKPNNVLIHASGRALLADFGLARSASQDEHLTQAGFAMGTPGYMAPEQVIGHEIDHRADIYAMGAMTFEMMTGRMPYTGASPAEIAIATVSKPIPSATALNPILPDELDAVLSRALAKDPADRPGSVRELVELLGRVPQRRSVMAPVQTAPPPAPGTPPPTSQPAPSPPSPSGPTVAALEQMGIDRLHPSEPNCVDWWFESLVHSAREAAGSNWPHIAQETGLFEFTADDPEGGDGRSHPNAKLAALTTVFENVYGSEASKKLGDWGRRTTERSLALRPSSAAEQKGIKLLPGKRRLATLLKAYTENMDDARGETAHAWRELDPKRFWVVHYQNAFALGRRRPEKACHFWIAAYESMLRWAGLANDWLVEEIECGCVTGTADCVFAIHSVRA